MACAYLPWLFHLYICSFTADFWKDKWQNWKDSLTSGKTDNTTAYFLFASEADYRNKLSRIRTERISLESVRREVNLFLQPDQHHRAVSKTAAIYP